MKNNKLCASYTALLYSSVGRMRLVTFYIRIVYTYYVRDEEEQREGVRAVVTLMGTLQSMHAWTLYSLQR